MFSRVCTRECLESIDYVVLARIALLAVVTFYCISSMVAVHLVLDFFHPSYSTAAGMSQEGVDSSPKTHCIENGLEGRVMKFHTESYITFYCFKYSP